MESTWATEGGLKGYDSINFEQIIRWDPEWIIAGAEQGKTKDVLQKLLADPAISLTQAARNGHIVVLENHVFLPMSPYTTLLVKAIAEAIYSDAPPSRAGMHEDALASPLVAGIPARSPLLAGIFYAVLLPLLFLILLAGVGIGGTSIAWSTILRVIELKLLPPRGPVRSPSHVRMK